MSRKKVAISTKPSTAAATASADAWVESRQAPAEMRMKRLTIDVSSSLHSRIKVQCAQSGINMADVIRELLEERFPER